jgi:hypothetical protein
MIKSNTMLKMASLSLAIVVTGFIGVEASAQVTRKFNYQGPTIPTMTRTFTNGESVNASSVDATHQQYLEVLKSGVRVNQGLGSSPPESAFFVFQESAYDPTSQVCESDPLLGQVCDFTRIIFDFASGDIPAGDLTVTGNGARLLTNISNNPNVLFSHCVVEMVLGTSVCTSQPPNGIMDVTFTKTNNGYTESHGMLKVKTGPTTVQTIGSLKQFTSRAVGTLLGWPVSSLPTDSLFGWDATVELTRIFDPTFAQ